MKVLLCDTIVNVEIIKKNNKNIYFRISPEGDLVVTCNKFVSEREIKKLIEKNLTSLERMYSNYLKQSEKDLSFYYLGQPYIKVFDESVKKVYFDDDFIYAADEKMLDKWYKKECLKVFNDRIEYCLDNFTDIPDFKLRTRKMKTRWGVNNVTQRIITLNTELLKKDLDLIDYVIIHELCHFYEANHSDRFWYQVSLRYPNYKLARKRLRN